MLRLVLGLTVFGALLTLPRTLSAQRDPEDRPTDGREFERRAGPRDGERGERGFFGGPGGRGPGGRGFGGPGSQPERKLVAKYDTDKNGWLDAEERAEARKEKPEQRGFGGGRGFGGPGGPGGPRFGGREREPAKPGERIDPGDVTNYSDAKLYDPQVLRTIFLEFENEDWEKELEDFHGSDVEVPAKMIVDGREYPNVGVHFRGMSSYMMVPAGHKRSLNLSLDFIEKDQRLYGYRTLNLLNSAGDESMMSTVLYSHIAGKHLPTPKANFVRVVINGENWGIYSNVEQFNKDFINANLNTTEGTRWKVRGNPGGDGGLRYLGEEVEPYKQRFTIKSKDEEKAWQDLIDLCRTLEETPPEELEAALESKLDIDSVLWFLAVDVALVNSDGYWTRASDYSLYQDPAGRFHLFPSDMNEAFHGGGRPGGPGMRGRGPGGPEGGREFGRPPREDGPERDRSRRDRPRRPEGPEGRPEGPPPEGEEFGFGPPPPGFGPPGFGPPGGRPPGFGGPGGPGGGGVKLDPLVGLENDRMPLRSKLLAVPALQERYLAHVREIAEKSLDWKNLGPVVADYRELIADEVKRDTRKLGSYEGFMRATNDKAVKSEIEQRGVSLRDFVDQRREYLLEATAKKD